MRPSHDPSLVDEADIALVHALQITPRASVLIRVDVQPAYQRRPADAAKEEFWLVDGMEGSPPPEPCA